MLDAYDKEIGENLILIRIGMNLTQEEFAKKLGMNQPTISAIESGKRTPSHHSLKRIAKALNTKLIPPKLICQPLMKTRN